MIVEYINKKYDKESVLVSTDSYKQAFKCMMNFLDDVGFDSHYIRMRFVEDKIKVDFGSHTDFFYILFDDEKERNDFAKQAKL
jgi:hypothetical protein